VKPNLILGLGFFLASCWATSLWSQPLRGPGDGPHPTLDMTITPILQSLPIYCGVRDFILWEHSHQLIYRDDHNSLNAMDLDNGSVRAYSSMTQPISRVVDPNERVLLATGIGRFFDAFHRYWQWIMKKQATPMHHLFWHGNTLYSIGQDKSVSGAEFQIYQYEPGDSLAKSKCSPFSVTTGGSVDTELKVAEGSTYPDVYIHKTQKVEIQGSESYTLWVRHYDLEKCELSPWYIYRNELPGLVKRVFWFDSLRSVAMSIDHPSLNLLWQTPEGIKYFDLGTSQTPMLPNPKQPVLATQDNQKGMHLIFLARATRLWFKTSVGFSGLTEQNIWLTDDGTKLYVAPYFGSRPYRTLISMDLPQLQD